MTNSVLKTVEVTPTHISCRRESGERWFMAVFALKLTALFLGLLYFFWSISEPLSDRSPVEVWAMLTQFGMPLLGVICVGVMLYCAGPADLIVDTDRRTYRFRRGFPLLARWYEGTLEDVVGLQVLTSRSYKSPSSYKALLHWRNTEGSVLVTENGPVRSRGEFQLGASQDEAGVRAEVDSLARRMGVPVLEQEPLVGQKRGDAVLSLILLSFVTVVFSWTVPPLLVNWQLDAQGCATKGVVTMHRKEAVRYTYQVAGRSFDGRAELSVSDFNALGMGSQVTVIYLPNYPRTSTVQYSQDEADNLAQAFRILIPPGVLIGVILFGTIKAKRRLSDSAISPPEEQVVRRPKMLPSSPTFGISPPTTDELIQVNVLGFNGREQIRQQFWTCVAITVGTALFVWLIVG